MHISHLADNYPSSFTFSFSKQSSYKEKSILSVNSKGKINFQRIETSLENSFEYIFKILHYKQAGISEPLVFSPVKCLFEPKKNNFEITNKENFKLIWEKYRDKYRNKTNQASILTAERLYFHTGKGMENDILSNAPYLPFFIPLVNTDFQKDVIIPSLNWLSIPVNLPLKTTYRCKEINEHTIYLQGWVSLDEQAMDKLMEKENFRMRAKPYHLSRDFQIDSDLKIRINKETGIPYKVLYEIKIRGKNELVDNTKYELYSSDYQEKEGVYKTYKGKDYTKEEWNVFEEELWKKYNQNKRSFLAD